MRSKKVLYLFFLLLALAFSAFGQAVSHRHFDDEKLQEYKDRSDYRYDEKAEFSFFDWLGEAISKLTSFLEKLLHWDTDSNNGSETGFPFIIWMVAILAVGAMLYIVFRGNLSWLFRGKGLSPKTNNLEYSVYDEDIHSIDFEDEIELAIQDRKFRKATRLFYLRSLKLLSDADEIDWKINKTNTEYSREIKNKQRRADFDSLSLRFEYIWYGEFEVSEETYTDTFEKFRRFNQQFNSITA